MQVRVHFDSEDIEVTREQLTEYLDETGDYNTADLAAMTDEELCAAINDYDVDEFYYGLCKVSPEAIRLEIAHD